MNRNCKLKKDDKVVIITGKDKNRQGKVIEIKKNWSLIIEGLNLAKKHMKPKGDFKWWIIDIESKINASNVMLLCNNCNKPVKVGIKGQGKEKKRFCKKCNTLL